MENFFNSVHENYKRISDCLQEGNTDLLNLQLLTLIQNISELSRIGGNILDDGDASNNLSHVLHLLRNQLLLCRNYLSSFNAVTDESVQLPTTILGRGRPKVVIPVDEVRVLQTIGISSKRIAKLFNISRTTLWQCKRLNNIEDERDYNTISDEDLHARIAEIIQEHPASGYRYIWSCLKARNIHVPRRRVVTLLQAINPIGVMNRRRKKLKRRVYKVKASNWVWNMDGNEKLVNWNMYIHGCVDGHSRRIIYLELALTKLAEVVLEFFTQGVVENGLPMRVRGDYGTENVEVRNFMEVQRVNVTNSFIYGKSVHNVRIERLWGEVNRVVSAKFRKIFKFLQKRDILNQKSLIDLMCLWYIYLPRIQKSLNNFKNCWNHHSLSTRGVNHQTPNQLWFTSLLRLSYEEDVIALRLVPEHISFNSEFTPTPFRDFLNKSNLQIGPNAIDYFIAVAEELVPDPLADDSFEGVSFYFSLRSHFVD